MTRTKPFTLRVRDRMRRELADGSNRLRLAEISRQVEQNSPDRAPQKTVAFFLVSSMLDRISLNGAYHMLAAWSLRLQGVRVVHFACRQGMTRCVLGTNRENFAAEPPCKICMGTYRRMYAHAPTKWFGYQDDSRLTASLQVLDLEHLATFEYNNVPLGKLVLPSMRWMLRRHDLPDDEKTRFLYREILRSAWNVHQEFSAFLDETRPESLVVFNGMFFPEATARWVAGQRGLQVITHEVGLLPFTAFFTRGEATAYPIDIPQEFELTAAQNERLDTYLKQRFQGDFSMAGIRFWPEMRHLDSAFLERAAQYRQIVPVFTNVVFDTSQPHSNTVFPHMFAWLEAIEGLARCHPETLFVLRAHPDEKRHWKESRQSVSEWVASRKLVELPNVVFFDSQEYVSSYELIQRSKFVMVYNSSIGLEAALMGAAVLNGGRARYTQVPTVFFPPTPDAYVRQAEEFLSASHVEAPDEFRRNARRFLYYQLFRTALPFDRYLKPYPLPGFVQFRSFSWQDLLPANSETMKVISQGILQGKSFLMEDSLDG